MSPRYQYPVVSTLVTVYPSDTACLAIFMSPLKAVTKLDVMRLMTETWTCKFSLRGSAATLESTTIADHDFKNKILAARARYTISHQYGQTRNSRLFRNAVAATPNQITPPSRHQCQKDFTTCAVRHVERWRQNRYPCACAYFYFESIDNKDEADNSASATARRRRSCHAGSPSRNVEPKIFSPNPEERACEIFFYL